MPNWVKNQMTVIGPETDLDQLAHAVDSEGSICQTFLPLDPRSGKTVKHGDHEFCAFTTMSEDGFDGYQHAVDMWGTKWGDCESELLERSERWLAVAFNTAWSAPTTMMERLSAKFPDSVFAAASIEEQPEFCVWFVYRDGALVGSGATIDGYGHSDDWPDRPDNDDDWEAEDKWYTDVFYPWQEAKFKLARELALTTAQQALAGQS